MMNNRNFNRNSSYGISDLALQCVMSYIDDPRDREAVSLVCHKWYNIESITRRHVTIALCYSTSPTRLRERFPSLESLKIKGKPRAAMFNLIQEDWGGYAEPWIKEISSAFSCIKSLHFRRMIVEDSDLEALVRARGHMLQDLKLDKCSGFSTDGLIHVARYCRCLRTLFLEESTIEEKDGQWLHELALNNSSLETLNFHMTELKCISVKDLELVARNCRSLISLKVSDCDIWELSDFFRAATALEEFGGGSFNDQTGELDKYSCVSFSPKLCRLGLLFMGNNEMPVIFPLATLLKKLDLQYTFLNTEDHCQLIQRCPNLEILEVRNVIGDSGLEVVANNCKKLRRLRIERGEDEGMADEQGFVSQRGLSALARGCPELEYLAVYVSDITNSALEDIGTFSKKLCDFRLVLLDREERITDLPLDNGVLALLRGCQKLKRFALYLRPGGLTDIGLKHIGKYGVNIRWMLLGLVGDTDAGLYEFAKGCPKLQKLEFRGCCFSERALSLAVVHLKSLRYLWVQGYQASPTGSDLLAMIRPFWNIEFISPIFDEFGAIANPAQILAYYSFAGRRNDIPDSVIALHPPP